MQSEVEQGKTEQPAPRVEVLRYMEHEHVETYVEGGGGGEKRARYQMEISIIQHSSSWTRKSNRHFQVLACYFPRILQAYASSPTKPSLINLARSIEP